MTIIQKKDSHANGIMSPRIRDLSKITVSEVYIKKKDHATLRVIAWS